MPYAAAGSGPTREIEFAEVVPETDRQTTSEPWAAHCDRIRWYYYQT